MISGSAPCFPSASSQGLPTYPVAEENVVSPFYEVGSGSGSGSGPEQSHESTLLYKLSILKDRVHDVQSLATLVISPDRSLPESTSLVISRMGSLVQEIVVTASSMIFVCQQMLLGTTSGNTINTGNRICQPPSFSDNCVGNLENGQSFYSNTETITWYGNNNNTSHDDRLEKKESVALHGRSKTSEGSRAISDKNYDIIELDAADLLAKYTHYCHVCGKGFKRDANLRMHMRAHGDEYKSSAALINPMKNHHDKNSVAMWNRSTKLDSMIKYSCPQEGCRWNKKHAKFQPLKSMICVKNHYKRSHCPKMYVCKRCNRKQFSVLSDLRTHEKHCGDLKWQCSCGTTFSRKDKLLRHVALFVGHSQVHVANSLGKLGSLEHQSHTTIK
ncbi:Zinc finger protein STAR3 [Hibiscus syriacus]|uniref:Zinc finger protein STAR3 n=1 Tax=Hibiscus syriacus TaxID=106335 RepID=A0A6A2ZBB6_HIBSY|nr:protein SENSITIVE TO PROTON RHIZOTOXICITY 2-like [Hibiscus syriacus]KAE8688709.1 Zinc finger protein STAR3 [Hibiscus syriacus]